jgi:ubiquinone/menaquinone biosynthesis C-methylase UbiE
MRQFANPTGFLGKLAGIIMAKRPSNIQRNLWGVDQLSLLPGENVLEIGFGPGLAIEAIAGKLTSGKIIGIDHSQKMLDMARQRSLKAIHEGKVKLIKTNIEDFAWEDYLFDKIFSSNVIQFWSDPVLTFKKIKLLLRPGGKVVTNYMARQSKATSEDTISFSKKIELYLRESGFQDIKTGILDIRPVMACSVSGIR